MCECLTNRSVWFFVVSFSLRLGAKFFDRSFVLEEKKTELRPTVMVNSKLESCGGQLFFFGYVHPAGIPQNGHFRLPTGSHRPVCTLAFDAVLYMGVASSEPSLGSRGVVGVSHALKL